MKSHGRFLGLYYDLRLPTWRRVRDVSWNSRDRRLFTPKVFGWGFSINFYWLAHPVAWVRARQAR
jgi:hypothetical protein